jgi:hypothetical protein
MKKESAERAANGITRRVFIKRSISATVGTMLLAHCKSWPAWADSDFELEGSFTLMARMAFDPDVPRTWMSYLQVDLDIQEIETKWGNTRVTSAVDKVMVKSKGSGRYTKPVDLSAGMPDAKLDPRIDARGGRVCVTWCACHPETRQWRVFAVYSRDGKTWTKPVVVAGTNGPALHPSVALDPEGRAWIAYEDWSDGSIRLTKFYGTGPGKPIRISESGRNYRPKVIVTRKKGKHEGSVAIAWDAYRDYQYDIYLRLIRPDGSLGPEHRATKSPQWDSCADLIEDLEGNLWLAWVRASNEISEMNATRSVYTRYFDGKRWFFPARPQILYDPEEFKTASWLTGIGTEKDEAVAEEIAAREKKEKSDGRITWFTANWFPQLQVDRRNRVYLFYRQGDPLAPGLYAHLAYQVYEGDYWVKPKYIKLNRSFNILRALWDFSMLVKNRAIEGVWDEGYLNIGKIFWSVRSTKKELTRNPEGPAFKVKGEPGEEPITPGWPRRQTISPPHTIEHGGERLTLLFGDTHTHSWTSDGADPADFYYHFARDYARLDFFALSDHDFMICGTPGLEAYICFLPKAFSEKDFICFQAYEFTSAAKGHRVVVFEGDDKPIFPLGAFNTQRGQRVNTTGQFYHFLHKFDVGPESRVLVTAHNMLQLGNDFREYDELLEPLYDITSLHIAAEKTVEEYAAEGKDYGANRVVKTMMRLSALATGGKREPEYKWYFSWRQCLNAALPVGAYGASDSHSANSIGWIVAGLWVKEKSRKAIFDAMFRHHSFALDNRLRIIDIWVTHPLSGGAGKDLPVVRMDIRFWLNEHFMGARCRIHSPPTARMYVFSNDPADPVREVVFVRDGKEVHSVQGSGSNTVEGVWQDKDWKPGRHYYYVRVELVSGNLGYSSPVFVNY